MDDAWFAQLYEASYRRLVVIVLSVTSGVLGARLLVRRALDPTRANPPADDAGMDGELSEAIATLPDEQREAVVLHYLADLPVAEVALRTGVAEGTVKSRLARAAMQHALQDSRLHGVADSGLLQEAEEHG